MVCYKLALDVVGPSKLRRQVQTPGLFAQASLYLGVADQLAITACRNCKLAAEPAGLAAATTANGLDCFRTGHCSEFES